MVEAKVEEAMGLTYNNKRRKGSHAYRKDIHKFSKDTQSAELFCCKAGRQLKRQLSKDIDLTRIKDPVKFSRHLSTLNGVLDFTRERQMVTLQNECEHD